MYKISRLNSFIDFKNQNILPAKNEKTRPGGHYTTMALGEEGGSKDEPPVIAPKKPAKPPKGTCTTMALGEEGGSTYEPPVIFPKKPTVKPPKETYTTMALGEEGGDDLHLQMESFNATMGKSNQKSFLF